MKTLHILNKSPQTPYPASQCARFYSHQDSIVLVEDATHYTLPIAYQEFMNQPGFKNTSNPNPKKENTAPVIYALKEDIDARGLNELAHQDIQIITYDGFVELTEHHDKSSSWY